MSDSLLHQAPLFMEFSRQGYWSGLTCTPPGDLPNSGIEPTSLTSPAWLLLKQQEIKNAGMDVDKRESCREPAYCILSAALSTAPSFRIWNSSTGILSLPGASVRQSAHDKGHEEGGSAYAKAGSSLRSPPGNSRASTPQT